MNVLLIIVSLVVFAGMCYLLYWQQKNHISFTRRVLTALVMGAVAGWLFQMIFKNNSAVSSEVLKWTGLVGSGYTGLLKMVVMPLIFLSIISAITNLKDAKHLGKYGITIIAVLLITTAISAVIGIGTTYAFKLNASEITMGEKEQAKAESLEKSDVNSSSIVQKILDVIPTNPFASLAGQGSNATLATVVFAMFVGVAALGIRKKQPKEAEFFGNLINSLQQVVMQIVSIVLKLTPYGILALMFKFLASTGWAAIFNLGKFVIASYIALALIVVVHLVIVGLFGLNPMIFIKKSMTVLMFAFSSRSSASAIPLTVKTQEKRLGVPEGIASLAASFGASIGQNGCAGMYPAMVAIMIVSSLGTPVTPMFIIELIIVITISSFGIAGVGGGATMAALVVLTAMKLPVGLVGVLVSIEAIIDMGRTLVNVSDALVAGVVTAKINKELDMDVYNSKDTAAELVE